ncbi:hypothetical protein ANCDUO_09613 [Ancylostoma duodenale]|uniref:Uncharacterized protein n=1 Tax=Ancylostoma duodenale TaxID=51022 RepID=A0A0C2GSQ6_9BILA|nr:hypothetical protein ANCDUO_09613 [Ancylostoma duodenale]
MYIGTPFSITVPSETTSSDIPKPSPHLKHQEKLGANTGSKLLAPVLQAMDQNSWQTLLLKNWRQMLINTRLRFREEQRKILEVNHLEAGVQVNMLPGESTACRSPFFFAEGLQTRNSLPFADFGIRVPPTMDFGAFEKEISGWCQEAGEGVTYEFVQVGATH